MQVEAGAVVAVRPKTRGRGEEAARTIAAASHCTRAALHGCADGLPAPELDVALSIEFLTRRGRSSAAKSFQAPSAPIGSACGARAAQGSVVVLRASRTRCAGHARRAAEQPLKLNRCSRRRASPPWPRLPAGAPSPPPGTPPARRNARGAPVLWRWTVGRNHACGTTRETDLPSAARRAPLLRGGPTRNARLVTAAAARSAAWQHDAPPLRASPCPSHTSTLRPAVRAAACTLRWTATPAPRPRPPAAPRRAVRPLPARPQRRRWRRRRG